jgi:hypothetical protein
MTMNPSDRKTEGIEPRTEPATIESVVHSLRRLLEETRTNNERHFSTSKLPSMRIVHLTAGSFNEQDRLQGSTNSNNQSRWRFLNPSIDLGLPILDK